MTIKEIAKLAGVSIATVSKIVNGKDENINQATREHVLKIVKEYNYTPYGRIKDISPARTFLLGVLLKNADRSARLLSGIIEQARLLGYGTILFDSCDSQEEELKHITSLVRHKADGIIWEPVNAESTLNEHLFSERSIPIVYTNTDTISEACRIDYEHIGYLLAEKLSGLRHTRIACLGKPDSGIFHQIVSGARKCMFDRGLGNPELLDQVSRPDLPSHIFSQGITGVICTDPDSAASLLARLDTLHCAVPDELSVISVKDCAKSGTYASSFCQDVSGIPVPLRGLGRLAAQLAVEKCEKKESRISPSLSESLYIFDHEATVAEPLSLRMKRIIVAGSIHIDTTFHSDALPQPGRTSRILSTSFALGGKGANQAVGTARLGLKTSLIGKVGQDADSFYIFDTLKKEHVDTSGISREQDAQTGKAYIYLDPGGESAITILSGADQNLRPEDITDSRHLFQNAGYCLLSGELPLPFLIKTAETGKEYGCSIILKPSAMECIPDELLSLIDILIPNRRESALLCPESEEIEEQADFFFRKGAKAVIITLGHKGCYLKDEKNARYFPAADFKPVDTTGGADAFIAALASYLTEGFSMTSAIQVAVYAAGLCILGQGVVPALPDRTALEACLRKHGLDRLLTEKQSD